MKDNSDILNISNSFINDKPTNQLKQLTDVFNKFVIPFYEVWWNKGKVKLNDNELNDLNHYIDSLTFDKLNSNYLWLPEFLKKIAKSVKFNSKNFINIHPIPFIPAMLADLTVAVQNPNNIVPEVSEATWEMEEEIIAWISEKLIGYDQEKSWGHIISGGTIGNMTALLVARDYTYHKLSRPKNEEVGSKGVIGRKSGVVMASAGSHYSLRKSLWFLGMGSENLIQIPVAWDEAVEIKSKMDSKFLAGIRNYEWGDRIEDLQKKEKEKGEIEKFYSSEQFPFELQPLDSLILQYLYSCFQFDIPLISYVSTFGTTFTGTIERINSTSLDILKREDIHIHIDAAWGGFALANNEIKLINSVIHEADSIVIDGHKLGFMAYPSSTLIFRDKNSKYQIEHDAPYIENLALTLEGSRPGRNIAALWSSIKCLGQNGYSELVMRTVENTKHLTNLLIETNKFQILHKIDLNCVAFAPLPLNNETRTELNQLCRRMKQLVNSSNDFLINYEDSLSQIKVKNEPGKTYKLDNLVNIEAVRVVICNPFVDIKDLSLLVNCLVASLNNARK